MNSSEKRFFDTIRLCLLAISLLLLLFFLLFVLVINPSVGELFRSTEESKNPGELHSDPPMWTPPDSTLISATPEGDLIRYGRELVAHTAVYLGPNGSIAVLTNGMNCQNCHLRAGKKQFAINFSAVGSTYPKFRARSGGIESVEKRVNDCMERSLNGTHLADNSREMQALVSYIQWVGKDVLKDVVPSGSGITVLPFMNRAADPVKGKSVYDAQCMRCHGTDGEGMRLNNVEWRYPPLWGAASFNTGAGLLRLSRIAGYVKSNMPNDLALNSPVLSDEEAWDVAAYIVSMPRPKKDLSGDWPDLATKPIDHPFGPYADPFPESQHKYGPFLPIQEHHKRK